MDFATILVKLNKGFYLTMKEFDRHINLVFDNCIQFNNPKSGLGKVN